jgi:hypothetical protein
MAAYREHITVSGLLGAFYGGAGVIGLGFHPIQGAIAGCLCWVAGMIPDLDSQSGRPIRELFSLTAALAPAVMMQHLHALGGNTERAMFLALLLYAFVRYGCATLVGKLSVHRGMFHSIPALFIAAEVTFLSYKSGDTNVKFFMAGAVAIGFLSHLALDEMYSVQWHGGVVKLSKSAGSAMKMIGKHFWPNAFTYGLLGFLTYAVLVKTELATLPGEERAPRILQQATELKDAPVYR